MKILFGQPSSLRSCENVANSLNMWMKAMLCLTSDRHLSKLRPFGRCSIQT